MGSLIAGACTPATNGAPTQATPTPTVDADGPAPLPAAMKTMPVPGRDGARTHLLALRHAPEAARMQVLPLRIGSVGLEISAEVERPALARPDWEGRFTAVVGHGGGPVWASAEPDGAGWQVVLHTMGATDPRKIAAPLRPAALHVAGSGVVVGADNTIGWIDLSVEAPTWQEIHRRPDMKFKAYDLFVRSSEWLIAIDDEIMPMYADSFGLGAGDRPVHAAGWSLPGVINGHYTFAALARGGARDGVLFTVSPYGIMDGNGQDLAALRISGDVLAADAKVTLNSTRLEDPPVLEEHVSRQTGRPEKLAAGTDFTEWRGLALHGDRALLAAGTRGLLVVPQVFTPDTKATVVAVGGECRDVLVADERTWVLVGGATNAIVELAWDAAGAHERGRTALAGSWDRLVR